MLNSGERVLKILYMEKCRLKLKPKVLQAGIDCLLDLACVICSIFYTRFEMAFLNTNAAVSHNTIFCLWIESFLVRVSLNYFRKIKMIFYVACQLPQLCKAQLRQFNQDKDEWNKWKEVLAHSNTLRLVCSFLVFFCFRCSPTTFLSKPPNIQLSITTISTLLYFYPAIMAFAIISYLLFTIGVHDGTSWF